MKPTGNKFVTSALLFVLLLESAPLPALAGQFDFNVATRSGNRSQSEYFHSNPEKRILINVNILSGTQAPGVYHFPDNTNLVEALALAGGLLPNAEVSSVKIRRQTPEGFKLLEVDLEDLQADKEEKAPVLSNHDSVFINVAPPATQTLLQSLTIVSLAVGIVSTLLIVSLSIGKK